MNIKNNVSLTLSEAVELLTKIADSLEQKHEFAFDLKGQEVSIEAGTQMNAILSLSPDEFSIVFNWAETPETEEIVEEESYYEPPQQNIVEETIAPKLEQPILVNNVPRRSLPDRMQLNTTTLPFDAGYWAPAFTSNESAMWTKIEIDSELENKKWASEDQITTLSDLTPVSAQPKKRSRVKKDDDLFSELDNLDTSPKPKSATPDRGVEKVSIPARSAPPAGGSPPTIPKPGSASIPSPTSKPPNASIPAPPAQASSANTSWQEPQPSNSGDTWVKPSEVLKRKADAGSSSPGISNIPSPSAQKSNDNKRNSIPVPGSSPQSNVSKQPDEEVQWSEPSREDNVTDDEWIRPSEFLKKGRQNDKAARPPPKAPDSDD